MATVPAPRTWSNGDEPTAAMLNTDLRDAYDGFFWNPPRCRVYKASSQSLATGAQAVLTWDSEVFDSDGMHDPSSNPTRLTVRTAGIYEITVHIEWEIKNVTDNSHRWVGVHKNNSAGTTWGTSAQLNYDHQIQTDNDTSGAPQSNHCSIFKECAVNDYFEVLAEQSANATVTTHESVNTRSFFSMLWLGTI